MRMNATLMTNFFSMDTFLQEEATFAVVIDDNIIVMYPHKFAKTRNHQLSKSRLTCKKSFDLHAVVCRFNETIYELDDVEHVGFVNAYIYRWMFSP